MTSHSPVIHCELHGDSEARACGITVKTCSPVLALCRRLVEIGFDPGRPLCAWRGKVLCLRVRSIGEAAALEINGDGTGFRPRREPDAASPIRKSDRPLVGGSVATACGGNRT